MQQLHDRDDHINYGPGGRDKNDGEHGHFFGAFACGFDQIFAAQIVTTEVAVVAGRVAMPSASAGMKKEIGLRESIIIELKGRFHGIEYSFDRSTS